VDNPYHPLKSSNDATPESRATLSAVERWIGLIVLGIISIVAIVVTAIVVLGLVFSVDR
jgi:hypothetical protein